MSMANICGASRHPPGSLSDRDLTNRAEAERAVQLGRCDEVVRARLDWEGGDPDELAIERRGDNIRLLGLPRAITPPERERWIAVRRRREDRSLESGLRRVGE